jgi:hypothetical protein
MSDLYTNSGAAPTRARSPKLTQLHEESRAAILVEQLSYLLDHEGSCPKECPDCARLRKVEEMLLRPFKVNLYKTAVA